MISLTKKSSHGSFAPRMERMGVFFLVRKARRAVYFRKLFPLGSKGKASIFSSSYLFFGVLCAAI